MDIFISASKNILDLKLDEAVKFFDLGFIEIIDEILSQVKDKNFIIKRFFSSTIFR